MKIQSSLPQSALISPKPQAWTEYFVQRSKDDYEANAGDPNHAHIQKFFCSNLTKLDSLWHHVILYDFKNILMISKVCDAGNTIPELYRNHSCITYFIAIRIERLSHFSSFCPFPSVKIEHILWDAKDVWNNFAMSNKWALNCWFNTLFYCGRQITRSHTQKICTGQNELKEVLSERLSL